MPMKKTTPIASFVLLLTLALSPLGAASGQDIDTSGIDRLSQAMQDGIARAQADREAREEQRQAYENEREERRQAQETAREEQRQAQEMAFEEQRQAQAAEAARIAAEQQAAAAERAAQELAANRSALDQNLGGVSLLVGETSSPNPSNISASPAVNPVPAPSRPDNLSSDPRLDTRLRQIGEYVRAGNFTEARKLAEASVALYPDDPRPKTALEQMSVLDATPRQ